MRIRLVPAAILVGCVLSANAALAVDSLKENARVFNDFSTSSLTITNNYPTQAVIDDRDLVDDMMGGNFANRHDLLLSSDGGATAAVFNTATGFDLKANVTLEVGSNSPRKETGIRVNSGISGDALFIINSDAGEIVAFGGGAPFYSFGNNGGGNGYTPGDTILMQMIYTPGAPGTAEYRIDRGMGLVESSGPLNWENLEGGPVSYSVGFYGQVAPVDENDFITVTFDNIMYRVPEPGTLATSLLGLIALGLSARRRVS